MPRKRRFEVVAGDVGELFELGIALLQCGGRPSELVGAFPEVTLQAFALGIDLLQLPA